MTIGEELFWDNARIVLGDIGMPHLDLEHGAAVDVVRWCLLMRNRPTHHRQAMLERESQALLAYLEALAASDEADGWRTLEERIKLHAELLRETNTPSCKRPWLSAIWHAIPELAALGQAILDRQAEGVPLPGLSPKGTNDPGGAAGAGDDGSIGKAGSASAMRPAPSSRFGLPRVPARPTIIEKRILGLGDDADVDGVNVDGVPGGTDGPDRPSGPRTPGSGGPK